MEIMYVLYIIIIKVVFILIFMYICIICFIIRVNFFLNVLILVLYLGCYSLIKYGIFIVLFFNVIRIKDFSLCYGMI